MEINQESIQTQLPYYLTQEQKENLVKALQDFPKPLDYYIELYPNDILQGDGWAKLEIIRFEDGARKEVKGIILSNSCDISAENKRDFPTKITFAPIIRLSKFAKLMKLSGLGEEKINNRIQSIREQKVTTMFYLPSGAILEDDYVALLDDLHTMPLKAFESKRERTKQFTLSQVGFYLFLLKLSVHFCRFHEKLVR